MNQYRNNLDPTPENPIEPVKEIKQESFKEFFKVEPVAVTIVEEDGIKKPLILRHLNITIIEWLLISKNVYHNGQLFVNTLFQSENEITESFLQSVGTNKRHSKKRAADLAIYILRSGIKINFLDDSAKIIQQMSPPLYDKFYRNQPQSHPAVDEGKEAVEWQNLKLNEESDF